MAVTWNGRWHPLAERSGLLPEDELRRLAESITEIGQISPCLMGPDGLGYVGRSRVAACKIADVEPRFEVYEGDPIPLIVGENDGRKHWPTGKRAMFVALGLDAAGKRENGRWKRDSTTATYGSVSSRGTWARSLAQAGVVLDHAPELANDVMADSITLDAAYAEADRRRKAADRVKALGGELQALVESGVIDVDEAERRAAEQERIAALTDDLAERVREGGLSIDEAEVIQAQNERQLDEWAGRIRDGLTVLGRMAGHPIPGGIERRLSADEGGRLVAVLAALDPFTKEEAA